MMRWRPTKPGYYLNNGDVFLCNPDGYKRLSSNRTEVDDFWSLLSPDWQDGPPTPEQFTKWQAWMLDLMDGQWACQVLECDDEADCLTAFEMHISTKDVVRSAPIQYMSCDGPLYLPLEVTK